MATKVKREGNDLVLEMTGYTVKVTKSVTGKWDGSIWLKHAIIVSLGNICIASLLVDLANKAANSIRNSIINGGSYQFERYFIEEGYPEDFPSDFTKEDDDDQHE